MENFCVNPRCPNPHQVDTKLFCEACGSELLLDGRYRVIQEIGGGGFGKTYEVQDAGDNVNKLLKVLINDQPKAIELFQREAVVLSSLNHPGIPKILPDAYFEFLPRGALMPLRCLVMEKIEGLNLEQYLQQLGNRPLDQKLVLRWLAELALILKEIHSQQLFHRDIKPANIMLRSSGPLALIDFGTARQISGTYMAKQSAGQVTGVISAGYTPPEQLNGQAVLQSDFYALGRTMVYLLTAQEPANLYDPHLDQVQWRHLAPAVDPRVADLLDDMMARMPSARPQNADVLLHRVQELQRAISALGAGSTGPSSPPMVPPTDVQIPMPSLDAPPTDIQPPQPSGSPSGPPSYPGASPYPGPPSYPNATPTPGASPYPNAASYPGASSPYPGASPYPGPASAPGPTSSPIGGGSTYPPNPYGGTPPSAPVGPSGYAPGSMPSSSAYLPNYLPQAILVTVFCCIPLGVVSIIYAAQVNTKLANGDYAGAKTASDNAKLWCWIAFGVGFALNALFFLASLSSGS
jgi:eukaryotic-like serine/threonine-protein kinase